MYVDITKEEIEALVKDFIETIHSMKKAEGEYLRTKDDTVFWTEITRENEYYFAVLSGYSTKYHKPYAEYLKQKELDSVGIQFSNKPKNKELDEDDIDVLELLKQLEE